MKNVKNMEKEKLLKTLQKLTSNNNHTEARLLVAKEFGLKKYEIIFKSIKTIRDTEGHLNYNLFNYTHEKTEEMLNEIEKEIGQGMKDEIYRNL